MSEGQNAALSVSGSRRELPAGPSFVGNHFVGDVRPKTFLTLRKWVLRKRRGTRNSCPRFQPFVKAKLSVDKIDRTGEIGTDVMAGLVRLS